MMNTAVAKRYGQALLQIGQEKNAIDQYQDELKLVVDTIDNNAELKEILISQTVSSDKKKAIVKDLFGAQTDKNIMNLLYVVIDKIVKSIWLLFTKLTALMLMKSATLLLLMSFLHIR